MLPPPPECWDSGMCYHTALSTYISVASVGSRSGGKPKTHALLGVSVRSQALGEQPSRSALLLWEGSPEPLRVCVSLCHLMILSHPGLHGPVPILNCPGHSLPSTNSSPCSSSLFLGGRTTSTKSLLRAFPLRGCAAYYTVSSLWQRPCLAHHCVPGLITGTATCRHWLEE